MPSIFDKYSSNKYKRPKQAKRKKSSPQALGDLLSKYSVDESKGYITQEFQDYGYRLACELNDEKHKSLYIKMAKKESRGLLEEARRFVIDAENARSKARLFMWKVKQLKEERAEKADATIEPTQQTLL